MATVRLEAIENFEEVRTFLGQAGDGRIREVWVN